MHSWQKTQRFVWFFSGLVLGTVLMTWSMAEDDSIAVDEEISEINADPAVVEDVAKEVQHLTKAENKYKEKLPHLAKKYTRDSGRRDQAVDVLKQTQSSIIIAPAGKEIVTPITKEKIRTVEVQQIREEVRLTPEEKRRMKEAIQRAKIANRIEQEALWRDADREALRRSARR